MAIWIDRQTKVLVQGITGAHGKFHALACKAYGTQVVAGVTPGKGGTAVEGIPVFDTVRAAVAKTGATASLIFVPAAFAADAILEAVDARLSVAVCITEGIPALDMVRVRRISTSGAPGAASTASGRISTSGAPGAASTASGRISTSGAPGAASTASG
ncbi:MAG: succinate--CoA ligase subunit alpha, partial [Deltaproteobacteria bacterium]|nr:succinate--CoA ligase subunit alpha [Deltaproteobacteria bacterium]